MPKNTALHPLEQALQAALNQHRSQLGKLYLACSGGRDSLSLAYACLRLHQMGYLSQLPTLIHINHRLQSQSDNWATQVVNFAKQHAFDHHVITLQFTDNHINENNARQKRYHAFFDIMAHHDTILLAHHADDQCETLLMRLVNGAGIQGLSAIRPWQVLHAHDRQKSIQLLRPWLDIERHAITDYANLYTPTYIDDPSNSDPHANTRTHIRHTIIPKLQKINPKAVSNIARTAKLLGDTHALLTKQSHAAYHACLVPTTLPDLVQMLDITKLKAYDETLIYHILRHFVQGDDIYPPNATYTKNLYQLICRTDHNHQTTLYWQAHKDSQHSFYLCRYRHHLYRYRADIWHLLKTPTPLSWQKNAEQIYFAPLPINQRLTWHIPTHAPTPITLSKKHAQRLGIPPWLRLWLWQAQSADGRTHLCSIGQTWIQR